MSPTQEGPMTNIFFPFFWTITKTRGYQVPGLFVFGLDYSDDLAYLAVSGVTRSTSLTVVYPAATFCAPLKRKLNMPSL